MAFKIVELLSASRIALRIRIFWNSASCSNRLWCLNNRSTKPWTQTTTQTSECLARMTYSFSKPCWFQRLCSKVLEAHISNRLKRECLSNLTAYPQLICQKNCPMFFPLFSGFQNINTPQSVSYLHPICQMHWGRI